MTFNVFARPDESDFVDFERFEYRDSHARQ
jgi:hypothetical protein